MIGTRNRVLLSFTPNRLRGALVRGQKVIRAEEIELDHAAVETAWEQGLVPLDRALRQLFARLSPGRSVPRVTLMYHGANAIVQTHDIPGSRDDAREAGLLKVRESGGASVITDATILARSASKANSWKVLATAERDESANKLYAWITRCGGRLEAVVPEAAVVIQAATDRVRASSQRTACCYIGSGWSAIACGCADDVHLIRAFEFGHRTIADVFQRALGEDGKTADRAAAEDLLAEHGMPFRPGSIDPQVRAKILPMAAPVLQRFCVEVKQTLRFGISAEEAPTDLILDGPGASIAHLASAVTDTLNMHVRAASGVEGVDPRKPFSAGTVERDWIVAGTDAVALVPNAAAEQAATIMLGRCLAAGVLVAAGVLGAEFAMLQAQNRDLAPRLEQNAPMLTDLAREEDTRESIASLAASAGAVANLVRTASGPGVDWANVMVMLADSTTDAVHLDNFEARTTQTGGELRIKGSSSADSDTSAAAAITAYVQALNQSPMVSSAELGSTSRDEGGHHAAVRHFTLTVRLHPTPTPNQPLVDHAIRQAAKEAL